MKTSNEPLVSLIIPVYNTEKYLKNCLISALSQTYTNIEIIIVDDGSPDNSFLICEDFVKKDNRISLIRQKNLGLSGARNTGIQASKGRYILFLDSDDTLAIDAVEGLVSCACKNNSSIVVPNKYTKIFEGSTKKRIEYHFKYNNETITPIDFGLKYLIGKGRAWRATAVLYDAETIKSKNIEFPLGYTAEDIVFNLDFLSNAITVSIYEKSTLINLKREGSITTTYNKNMLKNFFYIDSKIVDFLSLNNVPEEIGYKYRYSLLCRNIILSFFNLMMLSQKETNLQDKYRNFKKVLENDIVSSAFSFDKKITPFFNNKLISFFFNFEYFLIKNNINLIAFILIFLVEKMKKIN